jgi:ATP-dependent RNA helicase DDX5/DBP2
MPRGGSSKQEKSLKRKNATLKHKERTAKKHRKRLLKDTPGSDEELKNTNLPSHLISEILKGTNESKKQRIHLKNESSTQRSSIRSLDKVDFDSTVGFRRNFWTGKKGEASPISDHLKSLRKSIGVKVIGNNLSACPPPISEFNADGIPKCFGEILSTWDNPIVQPTPVQMQCWPAILSGNNILGIAPTGSGKTLAYGLCMLPHMQTVEGESPHFLVGLVLLPTRELVLQVNSVLNNVLKRFKEQKNCKSAAIYGGQDKNELLQKVKGFQSFYCICATPGRLIDLLTDKSISICNVKMVVIDEADRMIALGFQEQVDLILSQIRPDRQMVLFSATFKGQLRSAKSKWLDATGNGDDLTIMCGARTIQTNYLVDGKSKLHEGEIDRELDEDQPADGDTHEEGFTSLAISDTVIQKVHVCAEHKKARLLLRFIINMRKDEMEMRGSMAARQPSAILIFVTKIKTLHFIVDWLEQNGIRAGELHGQLPQSQRENLLTNFRAGKLNILAATDVAARGLHIKRLKYVVNYDFPGNLEQYVHRIGRVGRNGEVGHSYSLITRKMAPLAQSLIDLLISCKQEVEPQLQEMGRDSETMNQSNMTIDGTKLLEQVGQESEVEEAENI